MALNREQKKFARDVKRVFELATRHADSENDHAAIRRVAIQLDEMSREYLRMMTVIADMQISLGDTLFAMQQMDEELDQRSESDP